MPNSFKTATGSGSAVANSATAEYSNLSLAMVTTLGRTIAIDDTHDVGLLFDSFSLEGTTILELIGGSISMIGNTSLAGTLDVSGVVNLNDTTNATSLTAAAVVIDGGVGIAQDLRVGGDIYGGADLDLTGDITADDAIFATLSVGGGYGSSGLSVDASGNLQMDGNLTVDGSISGTGGTHSLTGGETTISSLTVSDLTAGRVLLAGSAKEVEDSANLTFDGTELTIGGSTQGTTSLTVSGDAVISGDLTVSGVTITANAETVLFEDTILQLANNTSFNNSNLDVGWMYEYSSGNFKGTIYDNSASAFAFFEAGTEGSTGTITISDYADIIIKNLTAVDGAFSGNLSVTGDIEADDADFATLDIGGGFGDVANGGLSVDNAGNLQMDGNLTVEGDTVLGGSSANTVTFSADIASGMIPSISGLSIGGSSDYWASIFALNHYAHTLQFTNTSSGQNALVVPDGQDDALSIADSSTTDIMVFDSNAEEILISDYSLIVTPNSTFNGNLSVGGDLDVTGESTLASAIVSDLSNDRIVIVGSSSELEDDANFRFDGSNFQIGASGSEVFDVAVATGNTVVQGTLDVNSTSTFAAAITLDGSNNNQRTVQSASGDITLKGANDALVTGTNAVLITASNGNANMQATAHVVLTADSGTTGTGTLYASGASVEISSSSSGAISLDSGTDVISLDLLSITESVPAAGADHLSQLALDGDDVAFLYSTYLKEAAETSNHLGSAQEVFGVNEMLGFKSLTAPPSFDLTESRGQGHLYTADSVETHTVAPNTIVAGSKLTVDGVVFTFASIANPFNANSATAYDVNVGADDQESLNNLKQAIEDPANGLGRQVRVEQSGLVLEGGTVPVSSDATMVVSSLKQPELYFEDIKVVKWAGDAYSFGTDLQAAYNSSKADIDRPAIEMRGYDLEIMSDDESAIIFDNASIGLDKHKVEIAQKPEVSPAGRDLVQNGLSFGHSSYIAAEALEVGDVLRADLMTMTVSFTVVDPTLIRSIDFSKYDPNGSSLSGGVALTGRINDGGANFSFGATVTPEEAAQAIVQAANATQINPTVNSFRADAAGDVVTITLIDIDPAGAGGVLVLDDAAFAPSGNMEGIQDGKMKRVCTAKKADASAANVRILGICAKKADAYEYAQLAAVGQVISVKYSGAQNSFANGALIGDEVFVSGSVAGEVILHDAVGAGLNSGATIFSLGHVVSEQALYYDVNAGSFRPDDSSPMQIVYMPRFVAIKP